MFGVLCPRDHQKMEGEKPGVSGTHPGLLYLDMRFVWSFMHEKAAQLKKWKGGKRRECFEATVTGK